MPNIKAITKNVEFLLEFSAPFKASRSLSFPSIAILATNANAFEAIYNEMSEVDIDKKDLSNIELFKQVLSESTRMYFGSYQYGLRTSGCNEVLPLATMLCDLYIKGELIFSYAGPGAAEKAPSGFGFDVIERIRLITWDNVKRYCSWLRSNTQNVASEVCHNPLAFVTSKYNQSAVEFCYDTLSGYVEIAKRDPYLAMKLFEDLINLGTKDDLEAFDSCNEEVFSLQCVQDACAKSQRDNKQKSLGQALFELAPLEFLVSSQREMKQDDKENIIKKWDQIKAWIAKTYGAEKVTVLQSDDKQNPDDSKIAPAQAASQLLRSDSPLSTPVSPKKPSTEDQNTTELTRVPQKQNYKH